MNSMAVRSPDEASPSPSSSLSTAAVSSRRGTPKGLPALLNKLVRAVLISKPLEAAQFLADYLDAELNRRTLCHLQDLDMTICDLELLDSEKVQGLSGQVIRAVKKEKLYAEGSGKECERKLESKCAAVQTDPNHLRYMTKSPFLQKMEAELISSVVENLNQDHVCRCTCPPPPLFWYQITRPQVLRKCRGGSPAPAPGQQKKTSSAELQPEAAERGGDSVEAEPIEKKAADDRALRLHAANDAGLARIIDRELRSKKWQRPPPPPPSRPKTPVPAVRRPVTVDASSQVETLVIQAKGRGGEDRCEEEEGEAARDVEHKYVQTMDPDDIFRPEEAAVPDQCDRTSVPIHLDLDEPSLMPFPDSMADDSEPTVDWSPFCVLPPQSRSSTDWLNIHVEDISVKDYDTDWSELTRSLLPVRPKEDPFIDWLALDIQPQPKQRSCDQEDELALHPPEDMPHDEEPLSHADSPARMMTPDLADVLDECEDPTLLWECPARMTTPDVPDVLIGCDDPTLVQECPARMMTPDAVDILTGCEDPSMLLGPDEISPLVVLQWTPVVVQSDTSAGQPLDIPEMVSQCPEPSGDEDRGPQVLSTTGPHQLVIQELTKKWEQISTMELVVEVPKGMPAENALVKQISEHSVEPSPAVLVKQESGHDVVSAEDDVQKQQVADSLAGQLGKQKPDHDDVSPAAELVRQASAQETQEDEILKQVFGEEVLSNSSILRLEDNSGEANEMPSVHSVGSMRRVVSSSFREAKDDAEDMEEEFLFGDTMKSDERVVESRIENDESPLDDDKKDDDDKQ